VGRRWEEDDSKRLCALGGCPPDIVWLRWGDARRVVLPHAMRLEGDDVARHRRRRRRCSVYPPPTHRTSVRELVHLLHCGNAPWSPAVPCAGAPRDQHHGRVLHAREKVGSLGEAVLCQPHHTRLQRSARRRSWVYDTLCGARRCGSAAQPTHGHAWYVVRARWGERSSTEGRYWCRVGGAARARSARSSLVGVESIPFCPVLRSSVHTLDMWVGSVPGKPQETATRPPPPLLHPLPRC
jgi:hypothetical protein